MNLTLAESLPIAVKVLVIWAITENAESWRARESAAFADGYAAGYEAGHEIGHARAHDEMARAWHAAYAAVQRHARIPTFAELETLRTSEHTETSNAA